MLISQQRVDSFEGVFPPYLLVFWSAIVFGVEMVSLPPPFRGDIPSHQLSCQYHQARIIELVPGRRELSFLLFLQGMLDGVVKICRCWVFLVLFVVSWYFVSSGQAIWPAGRSTRFFQEHRIFKGHFLVI